MSGIVYRPVAVQDIATLQAYRRERSSRLRESVFAPGLADSRYNFIFKLGLAALCERTTFPETTHKTFIGECRGFFQAGSCQAIAPTYDADWIIHKTIKVEHISFLHRISVHVDNVEPAFLSTL